MTAARAVLTLIASPNVFMDKKEYLIKEIAIFSPHKVPCNVWTVYHNMSITLKVCCAFGIR